MHSIGGLGLVVAGLLALLARSAWRQGELRDFLRSLGFVIALVAVLSTVVALYIVYDRW